MLRDVILHETEFEFQILSKNSARVCGLRRTTPILKSSPFSKSAELELTAHFVRVFVHLGNLISYYGPVLQTGDKERDSFVRTSSVLKGHCIVHTLQI